MTSVDFGTVRSLPCLIGDEPEDTRLLNEALKHAEQFMLSHDWCKAVRRKWFGNGIGGIVAVFLFEVESERRDVDPFLWVIVGDVPSAYLVTDSARTPVLALEEYIGLMQDWVDAVKNCKSLSDVFPVDAVASEENANALASRLEYLRSEIVPEWKMKERE